MKASFKRWCEQEGVSWRRKLNLYGFDPLPAAKLAAYLQVDLITPLEIPDYNASGLIPLLESGKSGWSAVMMKVPGERPLIVYNPYHVPTRFESNIMHELAHLILEHKPTAIYTRRPILRQTYPPGDEEEATYLGGCLQITMTGLDWAIGRGMTNQQIAQHFGASEEMVEYRLNVTGRGKQTRSPSLVE